jgi:hypothetical protein
MRDNPLVWLHGEIGTPPFSQEARVEAGYALRQLQQSWMSTTRTRRGSPFR